MTRLGPKEKGKSRPWARKDFDPRIPGHFTPLMKAIIKALLVVPYLGQYLARLYIRGWNPINYAMIGGIGVLINMVLLGSTLQYLPWYVGNALAIGCAWIWNWANTVGPLCHHWGFPRREKSE